MIDSTQSESAPIFVSTGGAKGVPATQVARDLIVKGFPQIELSGGSYTPNIEAELEFLSKECASLMIHNYFPVPQKDFVMNLASVDEEIFQRTREHILEGIRLTAVIGSKHFAIHAGFLLDPKPTELGKLIKKRELVNREKGLQLFLERFCSLARIAENCGVHLLVENNVLSRQNFLEQGENSLLLVEPFEILNFISNCPSSSGLLLDVGHLGVSAVTLGFDKQQALENLNPVVEAYHIHDNNSFSDEHKEVLSSSWFLPYLKRNVKFYTLEIHDLNTQEINSSTSILRKALDVK